MTMGKVWFLKIYLFDLFYGSNFSIFCDIQLALNCVHNIQTLIIDKHNLKTSLLNACALNFLILGEHKIWNWGKTCCISWEVICKIFDLLMYRYHFKHAYEICYEFWNLLGPSASKLITYNIKKYFILVFYTINNIRRVCSWRSESEN